MSSTTTLLSVDIVCERSVRFDDQCVLIPESPPHRKGLLHLNSRPRIASKSFTLPLWPTQSNGGTILEADEDKERGRKLTIAFPRYGSHGLLFCGTALTSVLSASVNQKHPPLQK